MRIAHTYLPNAQTTTPPEEQVRAAIQTEGIVTPGGGIATEAIATENVDTLITGQFRLGKTFSEKYANELESLNQSKFSGVPVFDEAADDLGRERGYYEVRQVDTNQAHKQSRDTIQYTVGLQFTGTRESQWRAVTTGAESISTGLASGADDLIGIASAASKTRWFDTASGKDAATPTDTVEGERGRIDLFNPDDPVFSDPTLLYEVPFDSEFDADVIAYDDRDLQEYFTLDSDADAQVGSAQVGDAQVGQSIREFQWTHVYHTAAEFEGRPVIDNGRLRIRFDEANSRVRPYRWTGSEWELEPLDHGDYELVDADIEQIDPALVDVHTEWEDTSDGSLAEAVVSVQRGARDVVVRDPDNGTIPAGLESVLAPIAASWGDDPRPAQTLKSRQSVK